MFQKSLNNERLFFDIRILIIIFVIQIKNEEKNGGPVR